MSQLSDIQIAQEAKPAPLEEIAEKLDINRSDLIHMGRNKGKIHIDALKKSKRKEGQLILVSAITPTPAGEGKTTISIGLAQGLAKIGKRTALALREPSMGPLFGMKGSATGGGYSQVIPMEDINLMFNGDFPAITAAHNLLAAGLDNAIHYRQISELDSRRVMFPRVMDMNDRALRRITIGLGGNTMGVPRETGFEITAASEIMAILALSKDYADLKARIERILLGLTYDGEPITAKKLKVAGAACAILREAIHPNIVQTLEGVPTFVHCGPFANIAHGSNSILATKMGLYHADYTVTEAGFGFDLGAEKFFDITCRVGDFAPELCVLVVTARALKMHGGVKKKNLSQPDPDAVARGLENMEKHIENIRMFKIPVVVAINKFPNDTMEELEVIEARCKELMVPASIADVHAAGGEGGVDLAQKVVDTMCKGCQEPLNPIYDMDWTPERKIEAIAQKMYGAQYVDYTQEGKKDLKTIYNLGYDKLAVCMGKTQKSLSDNPSLLGRPKDFVVTVRRIEIAAGAGFIVPLTGEILRMPGLPKKPAYLSMELDEEGSIDGLN